MVQPKYWTFLSAWSAGTVKYTDCVSAGAKTSFLFMTQYLQIELLALDRNNWNYLTV